MKDRTTSKTSTGPLNPQKAIILTPRNIYEKNNLYNMLPWLTTSLRVLHLK
jgi:hypothetical protein